MSDNDGISSSTHFSTDWVLLISIVAIEDHSLTFPRRRPPLTSTSILREKSPPMAWVVDRRDRRHTALIQSIGTDVRATHRPRRPRQRPGRSRAFDEPTSGTGSRR